MTTGDAHLRRSPFDIRVHLRERRFPRDAGPDPRRVPKDVTCRERGRIATISQRFDRFELLADLTVHGVTRPTTWRVDARFQGDTVRGSASTGFTFAEFGLPQPRVPVVLSVSDTIKLEYDFTLVPKQ